MLVRAFATFAYSGHFPFAPATFATAVFLAAYWLLPGGEGLAHPLVCLVTAILSVPASTAMETIYGKDPHRVVIDEVVGIQVVLLAAAPTLAGLITAFVLFRVFDVWKPFPIDRLQALPGGWGVVADDVLAGVYTRVVLVLASFATPVLGQFLP